jgi:hypothetical protein
MGGIGLVEISEEGRNSPNPLVNRVHKLENGRKDCSGRAGIALGTLTGRLGH